MNISDIRDKVDRLFSALETIPQTYFDRFPDGFNPKGLFYPNHQHLEVYVKREDDGILRVFLETRYVFKLTLEMDFYTKEEFMDRLDEIFNGNCIPKDSMDDFRKKFIKLVSYVRTYDWCVEQHNRFLDRLNDKPNLKEILRNNGTHRQFIVGYHPREIVLEAHYRFDYISFVGCGIVSNSVEYFPERGDRIAILPKDDLPKIANVLQKQMDELQQSIDAVDKLSRTEIFFDDYVKIKNDTTD